jgi:hypothetical protein
MTVRRASASANDAHGRQALMIEAPALDDVRI